MPDTSLVTRFPNGISTKEASDSFASFPGVDPTALQTYFDDFLTFVATDWTVTETQVAATQAIVAGAGGLLALTNSAADDDVNSIQKTPASFAMTANKECWFKCRFKVSDAIQSDLLIGLLVVTATPFTAPTDGIFLMKDDGDAFLDAYVRKDATTGSTSLINIATLANDTFVVVDFYYDGAGRVYFGVNGSPRGSLAAGSAFLPDAALTPTVSLRNGDAVARTLTVDYVMVAMER
jgi:hypothetical protein